MTARRRPADANPLGLTDRECEVMTSLTRTGSVKKTAAELGILPLTVAALSARAAKRMGKANRWLAVLAWHEHRRESVTAGARPVSTVFELGDAARERATP